MRYGTRWDRSRHRVEQSRSTLVFVVHSENSFMWSQKNLFARLAESCCRSDGPACFWGFGQGSFPSSGFGRHGANGIRALKGVSQAQSGRRARKGCAPLWPCMPVDSATAYVRDRIASGAHVRSGEPKAAGNLAAGSSCGTGGPGSAGRGAGIISALRTPPWLPSAREHQGQRLSRG